MQGLQNLKSPSYAGDGTGLRRAVAKLIPCVQRWTFRCWRTKVLKRSLPRFLITTFHADMHPATFKWTSATRNPSYIALDCAIVGSLEQQDIDLAQNILAFSGATTAVNEFASRSGWIPTTTDADAFEQVIAQVCSLFSTSRCQKFLC